MEAHLSEPERNRGSESALGKLKLTAAALQVTFWASHLAILWYLH